MLEKDWLKVKQMLELFNFPPKVIEAFKACYFNGIATVLALLADMPKMTEEEAVQAFDALKNEALEGLAELNFDFAEAAGALH